MDPRDLLAVLAVVLAAAYLVRRVAGPFRSRKGSGCSEGGCGAGACTPASEVPPLVRLDVPKRRD